MRPRIVLVVALTLALVAVLGGVASGQILPETTSYTTAAECYTCHQGTGAAVTRADFSVVGAVNYSKCVTCHNFTNANSHYHLEQTASACARCHNNYSYFALDIPADAVIIGGPATVTEFGKFAYAGSLSTAPSQLHALHDGGGWVERAWGTKAWPSGYPWAAGTTPCSGCHAAAACTACHDAPAAAHGGHAASLYPAVSVRTATGTAISYAASTCINPACHDLAKTGTIGFTPACGSCHPTKTTPHGYIDVDHIAADGTSEGYACSNCHSLDLSTAHGDSIAAGTSCATCHPTPRNTLTTWDQTCATGGCHTVGSTAPMHADTSTKHAVSAGNTLCLDCHAGTELGTIHAAAVDATTGATSCLVCHTAADAPPATADCTVCHFTFDAHYDTVKHQSTSITCGGSGCHDTPGLVAVHQQRNAAFDCWGCHNSVRAEVQNAITNHLTGCGDCHGSISALGGHRDAHAAVPPLANDDGTPNYSYTTGSVGLAPTRDCVGCHTSNLVDEHVGLQLSGAWVILPRYDAGGAAFTCGTCHDQPAGSGVQNAIAAKQSACESCHTVHAPIQVAHASAFVDNPPLACAECHSANLADEHNGTYTSTAGLTGCDVCHALYTGQTSGTVTGDAAQAAISVGNDTRCSACHAAYHTNSTAHQASSAATLACGSCHAAGQTVIDVTALHPTCATCHGSARIGEISGHTAECASCHSAEGTDYHKTMDVHLAPASSGCSVTGCHHSTGDVRDFHPTCATCHSDAADPGKTTACVNCHFTEGSAASGGYHATIDSRHTPADTYSAGCATCHDTTDVRSLHVTSGCNQCHYVEGCTDCHNAMSYFPTKSAGCATCHSAEGTDYHELMATSHTFSAMPTSCTTGSRCHAANTLPEEHQRFIAEFGYTSTCDLCHKNTDPARIPAGATADCASCHDVHGDIATIHTATQSQACVDCHETGDVRAIHAATADASCAVCHEAPADRIDWATATIECGSCHTKTPLDTAHYPAAAHDATAETGCNQCHYKDMKAEHFKATVAVTCVQCHETKVDAFTVAWDKTCAACHPTKHGAQQTSHVSTTTACGGTGCHNIADAEAIHTGPTGPGCGACHVDPATPATTTTCTDAGCHPNVGTNHHESHNAAAANPGGCNGCHQLYLDNEHARLGMTCDTCHKSTVPAVAAAIAAGDLRCKTCHPTMHSAQDWEFNPGNASLHRVSAALPGMRTSFVVNGATYSWSLPSASSFLKTGWTTSSVMGCDACHTYTGATGPQGATMQVVMDPAYPTLYSNGILSRSSASGMSTGLICSKCHDLNGSGSTWSNIVHKEHDDRGMTEGGRCVSCHVKVPHGAKRPRLLGASTDPAPYTTVSGGLIEFKLRSYTPNGWQKSDCYAACSTDRHPNQSSPWPAADAVAPTTGTVGGTVKTSSGSAIAGATVSVGGKTATTGSTGTYSVADVIAGTYSMTVAANGYTTWSGSVTITAGSTVTQNVTLVAAPPAPTTGAVTGTVTKSGGGALSGATVSIAGKTATTGSTGTYSIADITAGTYTMTVSATGYTTWSGSVTITAGSTLTNNVALVVVPPTPVNLAPAGSASASSQDSFSYSAAKAIDGSATTYWRSNGNGYEWLRVDLGSAKSLAQVVVNWNGSRYARSYRIETSNDGSNWTSRYSTSSGNGGIDTLTFAAVSARYVRVYCTSANDSDYRINEFEVWGY